MGALAALAVGLVALAVTHEPEQSHRADRAGAPGRGGERGGVGARVIRAIDGDTVLVRIGDRQETVRYIGLDTPESVKPGTPVQCYGHEASVYNARLVERRRVRLSFGAERRDVYGRLLAYVRRGDVFVNARLLAAGYGRTLAIAPNTGHAALFERLQERAAAAGRGLWGAC